MLISILTPSRGRPEDLLRLILSIKETSKNFNQIEILLYIDNDDKTWNPILFEKFPNVTAYLGPRVWMSNAQNFLYCHSKGEILMACADDFVFRTINWDEQIRFEFGDDGGKSKLVFGNDLGAHAGKIPTHFFLSRKTPEILGVWVNPGRASLWDLWVYEVFKPLDGIIYREDLIFEHLNFRQTNSALAKYDETTRHVTSTQFMFRPKSTYKKLSRERRIDLVLLGINFQKQIPISAGYLLGHYLSAFLKSKISTEKRLRILTMSDFEIICWPIRTVYKYAIRKAKNPFSR